MSKKIDNPANSEVFFPGTGKVSFWLSLCRKAQQSKQNRIVQLWGSYGTPFKTNSGAYCQVAWFSYMTMHIHMLLPERKQCFKSWLGSFWASGLHSRTGPKWLALVLKTEGIFGWQTLQKQWSSDECPQTADKCTGSGNLRRRHTKTHHTLC